MLDYNNIFKGLVNTLIKMIDKIKAKVGKRIIDSLNGSSKIYPLIEKLEKLCDQQSDPSYNEDGGTREMILEWAYVGCVLSALNGNDNLKGLEAYIENIKTTLKHNKFSDSPVYVKDAFNASFG